MLPSYSEVMKSVDMSMEAFSLMPVRTMPSSIAMTKEEVRALIEDHGSLVSVKKKIPGREGPGLFD